MVPSNYRKFGKQPLGGLVCLYVAFMTVGQTMEFDAKITFVGRTHDWAKGTGRCAGAYNDIL